MIPIIVKDEEPQGSNNKPLGVDFSIFTSGKDITLGDTYTTPEPQPEKKTRKKKTMSDGSVMITTESVQEDPQFIQSYNETNMMLRGSIAQIDMLNTDVIDQFNAIKESKTIRNKYTYISNLADTSASLLNTKLSAIKEMNSVINNCQKLELQRIKDNKAAALEQNDDKRMMDMYQAFINTPIGSTAGPGYNIIPAMSEITLPSTDNMVFDITSITGGGQDPLTPEQVRMRMENNPNIKEVVVYDANTGNKYFDVIDSTTGQSISGYPKSGDFLLDDTTINLAAGVARNANIDRNWPLVVIGNNGANMLDY